MNPIISPFLHSSVIRSRLLEAGIDIDNDYDDGIVTFHSSRDVYWRAAWICSDPLFVIKYPTTWWGWRIDVQDEQTIRDLVDERLAEMRLLGCDPVLVVV